jgi:hypothetical protein
MNINNPIQQSLTSDNFQTLLSSQIQHQNNQQLLINNPYSIPKEFFNNVQAPIANQYIQAQNLGQFQNTMHVQNPMQGQYSVQGQYPIQGQIPLNNFPSPLLIQTTHQQNLIPNQVPIHNIPQNMSTPNFYGLYQYSNQGIIDPNQGQNQYSLNDFR